MKSRLPPAPAAAMFLLTVCAPAHAQLEAPFDHVHLAVSDVGRAHDWYIQHMGGNAGETPETVAWGKWPGDHPLPIQLLFMVAKDVHPSAGTSIDHIGFSCADLDVKVQELRTAGVTIVEAAAERPGLGKQAVVEDPWGTKLVLIEDPDAPGLHHVELRVADPEQSLAWYVRAFGGDRIKYRNAIDAIRYRDLGVFYLFFSRDDTATPPTGHSIDHLGFGPIDLDKVVGSLKAHGATFISNPNPRMNPACRLVTPEAESGIQGIRRLYCAQPDPLAHRVVFVEGPDGMRVELVQHLEAGGH